MLLTVAAVGVAIHLILVRKNKVKCGHDTD